MDLRDTERSSVHSFTTMRNNLNSILFDNVVDLSKSSSEGTSLKTFGKTKIESVVRDAESDTYYLIDSGKARHGPYDIIIGADGVNSIVKTHVNKNVLFSSLLSRKIYSGIRINYAVARTGGASYLRPDVKGNAVTADNELHQFFGRGGYALTGSYGEYDMAGERALLKKHAVNQHSNY